MSMTYVHKRARELNKPIVDATAPRRVQVIPADITKSAPKNSKACAFARACEKQGDVEAAFFFQSYGYVETPTKIIRYKLPESMRKEIVAFDRNRSMEPGVYQMSPVPTANRLGARKLRKNGRSKNRDSMGIKPFKKRFRHVTTNVRDTFDPTYRARD